MTTSERGGPRLRLIVAAWSCAALVAAGCGSTRGDQAFAPVAEAAPATDPGGSLPTGSATATPAAAASSPAPGLASGSASAAAAVPAPGSASPAPLPTPASVKPGSRPAAAGAAAPASPAAARSDSPSVGQQGGQPSSGGAAGVPSPAVPAGPKQEIVLGSIGTATGVIGELMLGVREGAKAWAADVNARGGLNGHPVRVVFGDDGGDPSRALALARRMVDEDKVVAFYAGHGPTTMQAVMPFLEQRKVPLIGDCNCTTAVARSPMGFEVGPGGDRGIAWAHMAPLLAFSDMRKVSVLYCREVATCQAIRNGIRDFAESAGIEIVHEAQVTLTQPDYTAEVLAGRNAGAEAFLLSVDNISAVRVARSAHRQSYSPLFVAQYSAHDQRFLETGGDDLDGFLVAGATPHWTSPRLADYNAALGRFVPTGKPGSLSIGSWAAGRTLEAAGRGLPPAPTSADILKGLYGLRGETLGGLIPPLTFTPDKGSDGNSLCVVPMRVDKKSFVPHNGDQYTCVPGWTPVQR